MKELKIKLLNSEKAVSETVGYSFILAIVVIAVGILVVVAFPIQTGIQDTAFVESQIQALTMLDGRISSVGLGTSPSQLTRINLNGGVMNVKNYSDNYLKVIVSDDTGYNETVFNETLGLIEYKLGDNRLIYENGGMFRIYPDGESVMLSPPEFYYNGETLTFPVIRMESSASAGGKGTISVVASSSEGTKIIYPNTSSSKLLNPIYGKQIKIRIKSDNYESWARYITERTDAVPLAIHTTKEVVVSFNSKPPERPVDLVVPIEVFGLDTSNSTPLTQFEFNLTGIDTSNFHMVLRSPTANSSEFVVDFQKRSGDGTSGISVEVKYEKNGANETWLSKSLALIQNEEAAIDLLNSTVDSEYKSNDDSITWANETEPFNKTYTQQTCCNGPVPLNMVIQHYIKLVSETGTFALYASEKSNEWAAFDQTNSTYTLSYTIMPPTINYLHIVDHPVNISIS